MTAPAWWIEDEVWKKPDHYAAFRGTFELEADATITVRIIGAHWFIAWLDGERLTEGPYRFPLGHAEYETVEVPLKAGRHVLAVQVRNEGIETRMMQGDKIPPFIAAQVLANDVDLALTWKAAPLPGYLPTGQRVNPQFAWIEWVDTRLNPVDCHLAEFDDAAWKSPMEVPAVRDWKLQPVDLERIKWQRFPMDRIAQGGLMGPFAQQFPPIWITDDGYPWYQRKLALPGEATGTWRRYDLGFVRLGTPEFTLDLPPDVVIEIAYSEALRDGRVTPYIPLSFGMSRNLDHFISRGGRQTFSPMVPKGGRYIEIHIGAPPEQVQFIGEDYRQRTYYDSPAGNFHCDDTRLTQIWELGRDTLVCCAEDAIIDNPTRERGQWLGDALPALFIAAATFNDVRLIKRGLRQSAHCARADGLVGGLIPGGIGYLPPYSAQWTTAVLNYYALTGDRALVEELFPYAQKNIDVFLKKLTPDGVKNFDWPFIDWGYPGCEGSVTEMGVNLHVLEALRNMRAWCGLMQQDDAAYRDAEVQLKGAIDTWLQPRLAERAWEHIDFYCMTLALRNKLVPAEVRDEAIHYLKQHLLSCFPNDPAGPQLSNPDFRHNRTVTPYFGYYYIPELVEAGEIDFVLEQFRVCWGWALDHGLTTQPEVFNLNWSHCHVWASSPTAQISRWLLGLQAHFSEGRNHYDFTLNAGSLEGAAGHVPLLGQEGGMEIAWHRSGPEEITWEVNTPVPIWIHFPGGQVAEVERQRKIRITAPALQAEA